MRVAVDAAPAVEDQESSPGNYFRVKGLSLAAFEFSSVDWTVHTEFLVSTVRKHFAHILSSQL